MRTVSATITSAVGQNATRPVYLIRLFIGDEYRISTWGAPIVWSTQTWGPSSSPENTSLYGARVSNVTVGGATVHLPANDFWLGAILNNGIRNSPISIYEHHTDSTVSPQADAVLLFAGVMDQVVIGEDIRITAIENSTAKGFPVASIDRPTFNHLLKSGDRITWGTDTIIVN